MEERDIKILLDKYKAGMAGPDEIALLESWYLHFTAQDPEVLTEEERLHTFNEVWANLEREQETKKVRRLWPRIAAAASVLLVLGAGGYFIWHKNQATSNELVAKNDIAPGGNKAILTLANGKKISLTDAKNGTIAQQAGVQVNKTKNGQLVYIVNSAPGLAAEVAYNTIETPRGGQYQVVLPDGSTVWLNAASSITYPLAFNKNDRTVKINGEAYLEVVHHAEAPFRVETKTQTIEDIGTHFDVNAYADEPAIKTTLLEGAVKVNGVTLKPGQQAISNGNRIKVADADLEETIAWKNAMFRFNAEKLGAIMRQVSRWYDVEVTFENEALKDKTFGAVTTRFANVSQLLHKLELTGVAKFKIEGKKIIVTDH
jgi:transmembrane sensor